MKVNKLKNIRLRKTIFFIFVCFIMYLLIFRINNIIYANPLDLINKEPEIKILEIEPGDRFKLTAGGQSIDPKENAENKKIVEREENIRSSDGTLVNVTHINMPEFISMIDELNGKYDVIVIGRENTGVKVNEYGYWKVGEGLKSYFDYNYKYRDYTNPFSQTTDIRAFEAEDYKNKEIEYYAENDITDKRISEIMDMINSGQLVYMDSNIYAKDTYYEKTNYGSWVETTSTHEPIKETKLWKLYDELQNRSDINNFKVFSQPGDIITKDIDGVFENPARDDITIDKIVDDYKQMKYEFKRPKISNVIEPTDNDIKNRQIKIKFILSNEINDKFKINLYLDSNGDGIFKEDELQKSDTITVKEDKDEYEIESKVNENFFGYLGWKVEIVKDSGVKTSLIGNCIIERDSSVSKKEIKVLQIYPWPETNEYDPKPTDLFNNADFESLSNSLDDYDISIVPMSSGDFNKYVKNDGKLNGNYDAVIIGFGNNDSNYKGQFTLKAIDEIKEFIKTGQSTMFTSDTMAMQIKEGDKENDLYYLTSRFRDYLGQSRFKDPYNLEETDINGDRIIHANFGDNNSDKYSAGLSLIRANIGSWIGASSVDGKYFARNINSTQINSYPFNISNEKIEIGAHTKTQYYQLNLEDEDVVPLYNILNIDRANSGDSRNFYYAYSKGNITYCSSLGDLSNGRKFPLDELKLFINTIIKTDSNSNHAPIIKSTYLDNEVENNGVIKLSYIPERFQFTTMANDIDGDKVKLQLNIDGEETNSMISNDYEPEGTNFTVNISISKLKEVSRRENKKLNIKVIAEDEKGAVSEANYTVDLTDVVDINHGIYEGLSVNKVNVSDSYNEIFANNSVLTLAANLSNINANYHRHIELQIDNNLSILDNKNPTVYLFKDGRIQNKGEMTGSGKKFNYKIEESYDNIAIVYSVRIPEILDKDNKYINKVSLIDNEKNLIRYKDAILKTKKNINLPDLF